MVLQWNGSSNALVAPKRCSICSDEVTVASKVNVPARLLQLAFATTYVEETLDEEARLRGIVTAQFQIRPLCTTTTLCT